MAAAPIHGTAPTPVEPPERHVVLVAPEIHWNTGNIGRTCLGAAAGLHLVRPLGFRLDDRHLRRAGLDYWPRVRLRVWDDYRQFVSRMRPADDQLALFTRRGHRPVWDLPPCRRLFLIFGSETGGLPTDLLTRHSDRTFHIPTTAHVRSLNLSTAVGIALYASLRTTGYPRHRPHDASPEEISVAD